MNVFFINTRKDEDRWRLVLNEALKVESRRITTMKQIEEVRFEEDAVVLMSDTFPEAYRALIALTGRPERMTILVLTKLPLPFELPVEENKKIVFLQLPISDKEMKRRIRQATGKEDPVNRTYYWGKSRAMNQIREVLSRQKYNRLPIFLRGEIGTGKSCLAEWIAEETGLRDRLVCVNCSGLSQENLGMDKLFGHVEGAYTDGKKSRRGLIGKADGGILFLDEIQDLPASAVANLLTVLETGRWRPIGTDDEEKSRFRLITASSASREELYEKLGPALMSRIEGITLSIPPLRERKEDIPGLMEKLKEKIGPAGREFRIEDMEPWLTYSWPNNIRELQYKLEYYGTAGILPEEMRSNG